MPAGSISSPTSRRACSTSASPPDLERRIWEHRNHVYRGFTDSYNCTRLVWYEDYGDITDAIHREKRLKYWKREWKIRLIEEMNPDWGDLFETIM